MAYDPGKIACYGDFVRALRGAGFSMGGENANGIFALSDSFTPDIAWHTDLPETDPWRWRMRVLEQEDDVAYAKVFFGRSGYIHRDMYPFFLAARRRGLGMREMYEAGGLSALARDIYCAIERYGPMAVHELKPAANVAQGQGAAFERALLQLQAKMLLTMCGFSRKRSKTGEEYGWNSTAFCRTEDFFGPEEFSAAAALTPEEGAERIRLRVLGLNPAAQERKVEKFIYG